MTIVDEVTLAEMEKVEQSKKRTAGRPKRVEHTAPNVEETSVWVKCVVETKPFATNDDGITFPLLYWQDYKITTDEAVLLHDRKMVVILKPKGE